MGSGASVGKRFVVGDRRGCDAVHADHDASVVHHLEHVSNALVRLADEPTAAIALVAERQRQAWQATPTDLVNGPHHVHVVGDENLALEATFGDREQRQTLDARRSAVDASEGHVHDVGREIVIATGDEDLRPAKRVSAVFAERGAHGYVGEAAARLWLGQRHRAGPFTSVETSHHFTSEILVAERFDEVRRSSRQTGVGAGTQVRGHQIGGGDDAHHERQLLAADLRRPRGGKDAELDEPWPDGSHPGVHRDGAAIEPRGLFIHRLVGRIENFASQATRTL